MPDAKLFKKADKIKAALTPTKKEKPPAEYLSTGCALFNCALSGRHDGGFVLGTYNLFVGDSKSGKSIMCHDLLNIAAKDERFAGYDLIYDNPEIREFFDLKKMWGDELATRIQPPMIKNGRAVYSQTIQEFYFALDDRKKAGRPFIWIEDSMASLSSESEHEKFAENKRDHRKGKELTGSYGDGKAKANSANLRLFLDYIERTKSLLIIVNQTRDNIGFSATFNPKTWAGGKALRFYASHEVWSSIIGQIVKPVRGNNVKIGQYCKIDVKKNSVNGKERSVVVPILDGYGVDDIGACVDFLVEQKHWRTDETDDGGVDENGKKKRAKKSINAHELGLIGNAEKIIQQILDDGMQNDVRKIVQTVWDDIESQCIMRRDPK